jgi:lipid-binding SYLF domain-containing protein
VWAAVTASLLLASTPTAHAQQKQQDKLVAARQVFQDLVGAPDRAVPRSLLDGAVCVAVIPHIIKGAFGVGGRHGNGVVSCRSEDGRWSPPAFIQLSGGSFGFQIGVEATDLVLFFMTERGARSLLESEFTLGGDASVAAGPVGRSAGASTDVKLKAEIYGYAKSKGLFAGVSLEGARVAPDQKAIRQYYGQRIFPEVILFDQEVPKLGPEAEQFLDILPAGGSK